MALRQQSSRNMQRTFAPPSVKVIGEKKKGSPSVDGCGSYSHSISNDHQDHRGKNSEPSVLVAEAGIGVDDSP